MNAYVNPLAGGDAVFAPSPIVDFIRSRDFDRPTLVLHRDTVAQQYRALKSGLGRADIHYAVKANPAREIIEVLVAEGSRFDAASRGEIELCLGLGAHPEHISFGNTVKGASDIAFAHQAGITLFAADSEMELDKIAEHAPGAEVYIRLLVGATGADWPLSRKFGCASGRAVALMDHAVSLGLDPVGLSFHVGSQTRKAEMWRETLDRVSVVWADARAAGHALSLINIGGGFPETHAAILAENIRFKEALRSMVEAGLPVYAECGGLMYLGQALVLKEGTYAMAGVLPVTFGFSKRPQGHGYTVVEVIADNPYYRIGEQIRGHEFHYSNVLQWNGKNANFVFAMKRGIGFLDGKDGVCYKNVLATYTHIHALGTPSWAKAIVNQARAFSSKKKGDRP